MKAPDRLSKLRFPDRLRGLLPRSLVGRVYALYSAVLLLFVGTALGLFYQYQFRS